MVDASLAAETAGNGDSIDPINVIIDKLLE